MPFAFTIDAAEFADAVTWVSRALPGRPTDPQLGGILLEVAGVQLRASVYDHEVSARTTAPATVGAPGTALVSGRLLVAVLKALPRNQRVDVDELGTILRIGAGPALFTLPMMDHRSYPKLPELSPDAGSIDAAAFAATLTTVAAMASGDVHGFTAITGIYLQTETPGELTLVGTNRYRLARQHLPWSASATITGALVSARRLAECKIVDTDRVFIGAPRRGIGGGTLTIRGGHRETTFALLDEKFPDYNRLFPDRYNAVATVARAELAAAISRALVVTPKDLRVQLTFDGSKLTIAAGDLPGFVGESGGSSVEELEVDYIGDPLLITFNAHYLLDGLAAIRGDRVRLGFTANNKPAVLQSADNMAPCSGPGPFDAVDTAFTYLLMPYSPPK